MDRQGRWDAILSALPDLVDRAREDGLPVVVPPPVEPHTWRLYWALGVDVEGYVRGPSDYLVVTTLVHLDCVVSGCTDGAVSSRGRAAGLCREHGKRKLGMDAAGEDFWGTVTRIRPFSGEIERARRAAGLPILVEGAGRRRNEEGRGGVTVPPEALPAELDVKSDGLVVLHAAIDELHGAGDRLADAADEFYAAKAQVRQASQRFVDQLAAVRQAASAVIDGR